MVGYVYSSAIDLVLPNIFYLLDIWSKILLSRYDSLDVDWLTETFAHQTNGK